MGTVWRRIVSANPTCQDFSTLRAQEHTPIPVGFTRPDGPVDAAIISALKAKIGSTNRYTALDNLDGSVLDVQLTCEQQLTETKIPLGYACAYVIEYSPPSTEPLSTPLETGLVTCGIDMHNVCAQEIFDDFAVKTQSVRLAKAELRLRILIRAYQNLHPLQVPAKRP